jgi:hypothetical protein
MTYPAPLRVSSIWILKAITLTSHATNRFEAQVIDDVTGQSLPARIAVTDAHGKFVEIEGSHAHVTYLQKR